MNKTYREHAKLSFKGIRLDIYAKDSLGNAYDIEMQLNYSGELALRSRYYHSEMDGYQIRTGVKYDNLKESIVIFICDFDMFNKGSSIYTFETICWEYPELSLEDKRKTIFLNINGNREGLSEELSSVLDYFKTSTPTDEYTKGLEEKVKENRNDEGELYDFRNEIRRKIPSGHGKRSRGWTY